MCAFTPLCTAHVSYRKCSYIHNPINIPHHHPIIPSHQLLGLDAAALQKQAADRAAADAWEAKMHERMAAQEAGLVPLLQYEAKELRDNLARVGRPWKRLAGMAWKRGVRVWHAAVAE